MITARQKFIYIAKIINSCTTLSHVYSAMNMVYNWHIKRNNTEAEYIDKLYELIGLKGKQIITNNCLTNT